MTAPAVASEAAAAEAEALLVQREVETAVVTRALSRARAGRGSMVLLDGPPGIGKSHLVRACRGMAEHEQMDVLVASGRELESQFSFGVALQLFEARMFRASAEERGALLTGAARLAAPLLADGPRDPLPEGQAFSLLHGLYWLSANLAGRRPLVMLIDDAHWADEPSLRFVLYLAQRVQELPVAMVLAARSATRSTPEVLAQIADHPATESVHLGPLTETGVAAWLRTTHFPPADERFCEACHEATGGNPFLLRELAVELSVAGVEPNAAAADMVRQLGPDAIARAILGRVRQLGPGASELVHALAVAGDDAELRHCAALAGLEQGEAARLAGELADVDVFRRSERLAFVQPIVGQAVDMRLSPAARAGAHMRLAEMLVGERAPPELVAAHLMQATCAGKDWVVEALRAAAEDAVGRGAPDSAVRYLRRGLEEPPSASTRAHVMLELGRAEAIVGDGQAVDRLNAAVKLIEDPLQRARTALEIGRALYAQGKHRAAADAFRNGAAEALDVDRELHLQLHTAHALVSRIGGLSPDELAISAPPALAEEELRAEETPTGRVLLAYMALEKALRGAPRKEVLQLAHSALGRGALLDDETSDGLGCYFAATALTIAEDLQAAELALATAVEDARSRGSVLGFATACYFRGWAVLRRGRVADAAADAQNAVAAERYGWRLGLPGAHAILANAFQERGERESAEQELELGAAEASILSETPLPFLIASRAAFLLRGGRPREALDVYRECAERLATAGADNPACIPWRSGAALAYGQLGERGEALRLVEEELELSRRFGAPGAIGMALLAYGSLLNGDGLPLLREAVDVLRDSQAALDRARALVVFGTALRRAGKRREAREPLLEGLDLAERCGSSRLADQARAEALAAGIRPRRTALRGVEALTPRELQAAGLAAQGMSNREIAESLFVTLKTVEWHLRHTYEKLEIGSRKELRAKLTRQGERA
jgi:DNA-binding CsgD family transcriptional regulator/energy-coupling factor transporter ATP-binding protein EcfA2